MNLRRIVFGIGKLHLVGVFRYWFLLEVLNFMYRDRLEHGKLSSIIFGKTKLKRLMRITKIIRNKFNQMTQMKKYKKKIISYIDHLQVNW